MAVRPLRITAIVLVLILAGTLVTGVMRSRLSLAREKDRATFIATYIELAIARERYSNPDSLSLVESDIYHTRGVDSVWMAGYAELMSQDLAQSGLVWEDIVGKLDSIRQVTASDSLTNPIPQ